MQKNLFIFTIVFLILFSFFGCATKTPEIVPEPKSVQELILSGQTEEARQMFQSKIDINAVDESGMSALHAAAQTNSHDLAAFLLFLGADPNLKNLAGETPLLTAINNNAKETVKLLAPEGDAFFAVDKFGKTAFETGLEKGDEFASFLITEKTGNMLDKNGNNIVHYLVKAENLNGIEFCIKMKVPVSLANKKGITPLHLAYEKMYSLPTVKIAASLLMANATPLRDKFNYFEDAVKTRNPSLRFVDGQTPLHFATMTGEKGIVEYFIERKAPVMAKNIMGSTPLHEAVRSGNLEIVQLLLKAGANPNSQDSLGKTPFLLVTPVKTRSQIYDLLLQNGANPNAKDLFGDTPLHLAVMSGMEVEILEKLTRAGADINERNKEGVTPLALAVERKNIAQVRFLSSGKADIHAEDISGNTPLSRALGGLAEEQKLEILKIIVTSQNIASRDSYGNSPLHVAVKINAPSAQLDYLLSLTNDVNARNKDGETPLLLAVQYNRRILGEKLLSKRANVFSTNNKNYSALRYAMKLGGDVQDWLLTSEVIKATDGSGNTPLHYAAEWKFDNSVLILLEKGANINTQNANGETPLFSAIKANSTSTISLLIQKGAIKDARDFLGNTPLHSCVLRDAKDAAKMLILSGADLNAKNLAGQTPLSEAARQGRISMVTLLLDNGADINAFDATGKTILMDSIQSGSIEIVSLLLKRGASPTMQEMYGRNAYHEAAYKGNIQLINMVRSAGGNPLARDAHGVTPFSLVMDKDINVIKAVLGSSNRLIDSDGNTPLHIATSNKLEKSKLASLCQMNYPINARNKNGMTSLCFAAKNQLQEQAKVLLEYGADPFILDNSGECALTYAMKDEETNILSDMVKIVGNAKDMVGDGILHYAARVANEDTIKRLVSMGLDKTARNISGETPYDMAKRWLRNDIAEMLK